jgi:hypothetical protein
MREGVKEEIKGKRSVSDLQEGMDTFLGWVVFRGSLCLLLDRMHMDGNSCTIFSIS